MGSKRNYENDEYLKDESMGVSIDGEKIDIFGMDRVGFQLAWTGTPTGTFGIDVSNDGETWIALTLDTSVVAAGAADEAFIDAETAARWIRLNYARTSGTGTLNVHTTAKSISA